MEWPSELLHCGLVGKASTCDWDMVPLLAVPLSIQFPDTAPVKVAETNPNVWTPTAVLKTCKKLLASDLTKNSFSLSLHGSDFKIHKQIYV